MSETRLIQKQLAGKEDLLLGIGKATQKRASGDREITKLNVTELQGALVVETIEDLENLDPTKLSEKTVIVKDIDRGGTFTFNGYIFKRVNLVLASDTKLWKLAINDDGVLSTTEII